MMDDNMIFLNKDEAELEKLKREIELTDEENKILEDNMAFLERELTPGKTLYNLKVFLTLQTYKDVKDSRMGKIRKAVDTKGNKAAHSLGLLVNLLRLGEATIPAALMDDYSSVDSFTIPIIREFLGIWEANLQALQDVVIVNYVLKSKETVHELVRTAHELLTLDEIYFRREKERLFSCYSLSFGRFEETYGLEFPKSDTTELSL